MEFYEPVVVGIGPAGLTTSLYVAREDIDTLVIEKDGIGGQAGTTERIENYPGFAEGIGGGELADQMRAHAERFGVEILPVQTVTKIRVEGQYKMITTESGDEYCSKAPSCWLRVHGTGGGEPRRGGLDRGRNPLLGHP